MSSHVSDITNCLEPYCIDYSDKAIAVFGNTKPIKDKLKELGGRFNSSLNDSSGSKQAGWIFSKKLKESVQKLLTENNRGRSAGSCQSKNSSESLKDQSNFSVKVATVSPTQVSTENEPRCVDYSDKAIAVFGNTKPIKDKLKELGGRFNSSLNDSSGSKQAGWIFPKTSKGKVEEFLLGKRYPDSTVVDSDRFNKYVKLSQMSSI